MMWEFAYVLFSKTLCFFWEWIFEGLYRYRDALVRQKPGGGVNVRVIQAALCSRGPGP